MSMKNLLPLAVISSFFACNPNPNDPGNPDNEKQEIIHETRPHINKEKNIIIEIWDTLKWRRDKKPISDKIEWYSDSIYFSLTKQKEEKKEISQTVTIDGIEFSITVNNDTVVFECSDLDKIREKYNRMEYNELKNFLIKKRNWSLPYKEYEKIKKYYVEELLQSKIQKLKHDIQRDFQTGELSDYNCYNRLKLHICRAFDGYFYDPGIYYQTKNVMKKRK